MIIAIIDELCNFLSSNLVYFDEWSNTAIVPKTILYNGIKLYKGNLKSHGINAIIADMLNQAKLPISQPIIENIYNSVIYKLPIHNTLISALNSLGDEWDKEKRLDKIADLIFNKKCDEYSNDLFYRLCRAIINRAYYPGIKQDELFILAGPMGYSKSTICGVFSDCIIDNAFFKCNKSIFNDDFVKLISTALVVELPEIENLLKTKYTYLKAIIDVTEDVYIPKYSNIEQRNKRHCTFIATSNKPTLLFDPDGARKLAPFWVDEQIVVERAKPIIKQVYGELMRNIKNIKNEYYTETKQHKIYKTRFIPNGSVFTEFQKLTKNIKIVNKDKISDIKNKLGISENNINQFLIFANYIKTFDENNNIIFKEIQE